MTLYVDVFDVKKLKKKLDAFETQDKKETLTLLEQLANYKIDREMLAQSNIHVTLSRIVKNKSQKIDGAVIDKAKSIRNLWKGILSGQPDEAQKKNPASTFNNEDELFDQRPHKVSAPIQKHVQPVEEVEISYDDKNRAKIFNMIREKFRGQFAKNNDLNNFAKEVEQAIFTAAESMKVDYVKHARERILVLSDKEHQKEIIEGLVKNLISLNDYAEKEPRELLSKHKMEELEEKAKMWSMAALQSDFYMRNTETKDSEFQCPRCKHRKIFSTQKQTRSADEPMTTFFKCLNCDYNWKMC
jgi:transcription elongation factor S-II